MRRAVAVGADRLGLRRRQRKGGRGRGAGLDRDTQRTQRAWGGEEGEFLAPGQVAQALVPDDEVVCLLPQLGQRRPDLPATRRWLGACAALALALGPGYAGGPPGGGMRRDSGLRLACAGPVGWHRRTPADLLRRICD